jgi:hypothetical protein
VRCSCLVPVHGTENGLLGTRGAFEPPADQRPQIENTAPPDHGLKPVGCRAALLGHLLHVACCLLLVVISY